MSDEPITLEEAKHGVCWHCGQPLLDPDEGAAGLGRLVRKGGEDDLADLVVHRACEEMFEG